MEQGAYATLIAAGLTALVAAMLFVVGEYLKLKSGREAERRQAIGRVLDALADVVREARRPRFLLRWSKTPIEVGIASTHLFATLPPRDHVLVDWLAQVTQQLADGKSVADRVEIAAMASGTILAWTIRPRRVRKRMRAGVDRWASETK